MLSKLLWLGLEAKTLDESRKFYSEKLNLEIEDENENEIVFRVGDTNLILRTPSIIPRGGVHTHFAFSTGGYEEWRNKLTDCIVEERDFKNSKSLYFYDPFCNCVEIGERGQTKDLDGIFEIVLEVEDLTKSIEFYKKLGMDSLNSQDKRPRERLISNAVDLEIWEPHIGIAGGQGGLHVDMGFKVENTDKLSQNIKKEALSVKNIKQGIQIKDPDGHYLTLLE